MKHALIVPFLFLVVILSAQFQEQTYHTTTNADLPHRVQLMYTDAPDPGAVIAAYEAHYRTHEFVKNQHTQYYKHWLRNLSRDPDGLWNTRLSAPDRRAVEDNRAAYLARRNAPAARSLNAWSCLGPIDYDHDAAGRSYAPGAGHVYTVELAPSNDQVLYAGTSTASVWKTTDYGLNWTSVTKDLPINTHFII